MRLRSAAKPILLSEDIGQSTGPSCYFRLRNVCSWPPPARTGGNSDRRLRDDEPKHQDDSREGRHTQPKPYARERTIAGW